MPLYDYSCRSCDNEFTESHSVDNRKIPLEKPCDQCGGELFQRISGTSLVTDHMTLTRRAGSEWQDVLKGIKKASGKDNTIKT